MIKLRVYGTPVPQGSTRAFAVRKGGRPTGAVVVTGDNPKTKSWRAAIVDAALAAIRDAAHDPGRDGVTEEHAGQALAVTLVFTLPRPAGHFGSGKNAGQVKPSAPPFPVAKPDLDKLCRAVLDALTDAGVWRDDSQVASLTAAKVYASGNERPGCVIEVSTLG